VDGLLFVVMIFFNDIDLRIQYDHAGNGRDLKSGDKFHEQMKEVRKNDEKHFQERVGCWGDGFEIGISTNFAGFTKQIDLNSDGHLGFIFN